MVQGRDRLRRQLEAYGEELIAGVRRELERSAEEIVREMRRLAPRGTTGQLLASIGWTWGEAPAGTMSVGQLKGRDARIAITIYAGGGKAFYARFQEFGTVAMPANPFFYPVFRANRSRVRGRLSRAIRKVARKAKDL